jgi:LacI family transcriptional regulator
MAVTMRDVAARAGVTPTVVSRVLHNKASTVRVSAATAERVRMIAKEMRYRVNVTARNFRDQQTYMIGILHGLGFERQRLSEGSRYFACLVDGIIDRTFHYGYSVTFCPALMGDNPGQAVSDGRFDGLIWYSTDLTKQNSDLIQNCISPLVVIHASENDFEGKVSSVICDNYGGLSLAIDHLVGHGHEKIGFVLEKRETFSEAIERSRIFGQILKERNLPFSQGSIIFADDDRSGLRAILRDGNCSAVIASSETLAADILRVAGEEGVAVPDQLSVIGFDSTEYCNGLTPKLSAISQPLQRIGSAAVDLLMAQINDLPVENKHLVIPCGFDTRQSTSSIRNIKK